MKLKERVENNVDVDWRNSSFLGDIWEIKRKRNQVYNNRNS